MTSRYRNIPQSIMIRKRSTSLTHEQSVWKQTNVSPIPRDVVNAKDAHPGTGTWIGQSRVIHAPPGAGFGKPTNATSDAVLWKSKPKGTLADTSPKRKSLTPARDATGPNPGRPQFGSGAEREYK